MGKLLQLIGGLALGFMLLSKAAGSASSAITWAVLPLKLSDLQLEVIEGKLAAVIVSRLQIRNDNPVGIYLERYEATISQEGSRLAELDTTTRIELPAGETRQLTARFVIQASEFVGRLEQLLKGGNPLADINIDGALTLSEGLVLPISRKLSFLQLT